MSENAMNQPGSPGYALNEEMRRAHIEMYSKEQLHAANVELRRELDAIGRASIKEQARIAQLEAARELSAVASATMRDESIAKSARIAALEAALREARVWIEEDTEALRASHMPYNDTDPIDQEVCAEVDARLVWLRATAETEAKRE